MRWVVGGGAGRGPLEAGDEFSTLPRIDAEPNCRYWRLAERTLGDGRIDTITADDCEAVVLAAADRARAKRPGSDARPPRENCVAALRALFERARRATYVLENPAAEVGTPRRLPSCRALRRSG